MKTRLNKTLILIGFCLGVLLIGNSLRADELEDLTKGLITTGISPNVIESLFTGPADTLGQRALDMLNNGTITQRQYDKIYNSFVTLPDETRWFLKNAYDKGYAEKIYNQITNAAHKRLGMDDASLRNHIKDLKQQGLTREQIIERLRNEGVSVDHLKNLELGQVLGPGPVEPSRPEHGKDLRDTGAEHQMDLGHDKFKAIKDQPSRPGHIKDKGKSPQNIKKAR